MFIDGFLQSVGKKKQTIYKLPRRICTLSVDFLARSTGSEAYLGTGSMGPGPERWRFKGGKFYHFLFTKFQKVFSSDKI